MYSEKDSKTDFIEIYFIHGSLAKSVKKQNKTKNRIGGILGGHLEVLIDGFVYGFEPKDKTKVHIFSRKKKEDFNSVFTKKVLEEWRNETKNDHITTVRVPVSEKQKNFLFDSYEICIQECPYDYAFFGMRCGASFYEICAWAQIFPPLKNRTQYILNAFYPRLFRYAVLNWAKRNKFEIKTQKGSGDYLWEK